ncbi:AAA family ATPase [Methylocella sp.]|uniref:AAA family ATPase n=1 Tax=Methylocella sp. TaxID=1978226 RepID=UPI003C1D60BD
MVASALKDESAGLIEVPELRNEKILPAAVVYGANASGKSNFVKAISHMVAMVRDSFNRGEPGGPIPLKPFLLDPSYVEKPSAFTIDFIWNGARYSYGFEVTSKEVLGEFLYVWRTGRETKLFTRDLQTFDFGHSLRGRNKLIEDLTRSNSLFLSAAWQNNHEQLSELTQFFRSIFVYLGEQANYSSVYSHLSEKNQPISFKFT